MQYTAREISNFVDGTIEGNPLTVVHTVSKIEEGAEGSLSFLANPKYEQYAYTTEASILLVDDEFEATENIKPTLIRVPDPYHAFTRILEHYSKRANEKVGIEQPSYIAETAQYESDLYLGAFAYIGTNTRLAEGVKIHAQAFIGEGVSIGKGTIINAGVRIYAGCKIGANCVIHSGTVIGSDGFGFAPQADGSYKKVPQIGNVIIEDNVEIGSNCCIDRATVGSTIVKEGVKLDNLIQVAHNVVIDKHTVVAAQTGISGSTKVGKFCKIGGQVGFVGHIEVADGSGINAQSGVAKSIKTPNKNWSGTPVREFRDHYKTMARVNKLSDYEQRIIELERQLKELKEKNA